jgi:hypothetical protein
LPKEYEKEIEPIMQMPNLKSRLLKRSTKNESIFNSHKHLRPGHSRGRMRCNSACLKDKSYERFGPIQIGKDIWRIRNNTELDHVIN